jgi:hypothetical protein
MGHEWAPIRPFRYSAVSWLLDRMDLRPMGSAEVVITSPCDEEIVKAFHIPRPFDNRTHATLVVHATRGNGNDGGVITLAISDFEVVRDDDDILIPPKPMDMTLLRNPARRDYPDDNGANDLGD